MTDRLTPEKRSWLMSRVKSRDTTPEIAVRKAAFSLGLRFRLHTSKLPGRPDLIFPRWKKVIFVHGCFWHRHPGCRKATTPKSNEAFWEEKFRRNVDRDERVLHEISILGWDPLVIWQCQTRSDKELKDRLISFFQIDPETRNVSETSSS
ncbi:DNA mismatch endonuclease Vsr [Agrobacterium sp. CFBP2214]|jgi:DNA mismatch endonuclease (patch repair protein)|uniref:very short patch repair endonuclease n=1 Tax=Agrobacterium sp. CFBP2214 TaxID=3040274 RepID=UPI00101A1232|nr:DNA mismatch endonuclease Vsr [Agrobacterium sp. CFBP2214]